MKSNTLLSGQLFESAKYITTHIVTVPRKHVFKITKKALRNV